MTSSTINQVENAMTLSDHVRKFFGEFYIALDPVEDVGFPKCSFIIISLAWTVHFIKGPGRGRNLRDNNFIAMNSRKSSHLE